MCCHNTVGGVLSLSKTLSPQTLSNAIICNDVTKENTAICQVDFPINYIVNFIGRNIVSIFKIQNTYILLKLLFMLKMYHTLLLSSIISNPNTNIDNCSGKLAMPTLSPKITNINFLLLNQQFISMQHLIKYFIVK